MSWVKDFYSIEIGEKTTEPGATRKNTKTAFLSNINILKCLNKNAIDVTIS